MPAAETITLDLAPRNPALLERLARRSSARPPLSAARIAELFLPDERQVARVAAAMARAGYRPAGRSGLALRFSRPAAPLAARAAAAAVPPEIADLVTYVDGTGADPPPTPRAVVSARVPKPSCPGPNAVPGLLPSDLAGPRGYGYEGLLTAGYDGDGERLAVVEFSGYRPADVARYQRCFGTSVPVVDRPVAGGISDLYAAQEVAMNLDAAISAAPGLDAAYVYLARPKLSMATVLNQIVAEAPNTGVTVVSISWGQCERLTSPARSAATAQALQLAAVSGLSVFVAAGNTGSLDCFGVPPRSVDDPSAQPFATGVGGSELHLSRSGAEREVVWHEGGNAGGGGMSRFWPMPDWQAPAAAQPVTGKPCRSGDGACRQVPDLALNAATGPRGFVMYCSTDDCDNRGWTTIGGTSVAAPLMAGIAASANEYSLAHGGARLGFANPFLYRMAVLHPGMFRDITLGGNDLPGSRGRFQAGAGYDMASGLGSVRAMRLAARLAAFSGGVPLPEATALSATRPPVDRRIRYGQRVTFTGVLTAAGDPVAGERVYLQGEDRHGVREWSTLTGPDGRWTIELTTAVSERLRWRAAYLGSDLLTPAVAPGSVVRVAPRITVQAPAEAVPGTPFALAGRTHPVLEGRSLLAQYRRPGGAWRWLGPATVGDDGGLQRDVRLATAGTFEVRWRYRGSPGGRWLSAAAPPATVVVHR